nr:hypothetical protein [Burkholderia thailandensis]
MAMRSFRNTAEDSNALARPSRPDVLLLPPSPAMKLNNPVGFFFAVFNKPAATDSPPDPVSVMAAPIRRENNSAIDDRRAVVRDSPFGAAPGGLQAAREARRAPYGSRAPILEKPGALDGLAHSRPCFHVHGVHLKQRLCKVDPW